MLYQKLVCFFVLFQILLSESAETPEGNSFLLKLANHTQSSRNQNIEKKNKPVEVKQADLKCKYKCMGMNVLKPKFVGQIGARFFTQSTNDSTKNSEMEAPAGKFSIFNLLSKHEEGEDEQDNDIRDDETTKHEKENESDDDDVFNFFGSDEEVDLNKLEGTNHESLLKQYQRQTLRMHNLMFPLLLAYKLKFFTVLPLLLGSLVLLVGTTGIAGFFFALFAAALGIHVKSHQP